MPRYRYSAINEEGRWLRGEMLADNPIDLEQRIGEIGFFITKSKPIKERRAQARKIKRHDIVFVCVQLATALESGIPAIEALSDVRDSMDNQILKETLTDIIERVSAGESPARAFAAHQLIFGDMLPGLLASSEKTGRLEDAFTSAASYLEWMDEIASKVRKLMTYPSVVMIIAVVVVGILMIKVVPSLAKMMTMMGMKPEEMPWISTSLFAFSDFVVGWWPLLLVTPVALVAGWVSARKHPQMHYQQDRLLLALPIFGEVLRRLGIARFARHVATLYKAGVSLPEALDTAKDVIGNGVLEESVAFAATRLLNGEPLSTALRASGQFPELVLRMIRVGEQTGRLDQSLDRVVKHYERQADESIQKALSAIEPALMSFMGLIVGWVAAGFFLPYYQIIGKI